MWIMTSFGILMPSVRPADLVPEGDDRVLQIRARRRRDIDILRDRYMPTLDVTIHIPNTDYEYRAYCTREAWAAALVAMSEDIDYTKFKPTTEDKFKDKALHALYNRIWGVVLDAFDHGMSSYSPRSTRRTTTTYVPAPKRSRKRGKGRKNKPVAVVREETWYEEPKHWWDDLDDVDFEAFMDTATPEQLEEL
jgi:hypothetical protein